MKHQLKIGLLNRRISVGMIGVGAQRSTPLDPNLSPWMKKRRVRLMRKIVKKPKAIKLVGHKVDHMMMKRDHMMMRNLPKNREDLLNKDLKGKIDLNIGRILTLRRT
jgi:hypothetical protein